MVVDINFQSIRVGGGASFDRIQCLQRMPGAVLEKWRGFLLIIIVMVKTSNFSAS